MSYAVHEVEEIGPGFAAELERCGIKTISGLLKRCSDPVGRKRVAAQSGIPEAQLLRWANIADLMRVRGIGRQYAELLLGAGVDSIRELRARRPTQLARKLAEINAVRNLTRRVPIPSMVEEWMEIAAKLPPMIT